MPTSHTPSPYPLALGRNAPATKVRRCQLALLVVPTVTATSTTKFVPVPGPSHISFNSAESYTHTKLCTTLPRTQLRCSTSRDTAPHSDAVYHAAPRYTTLHCTVTLDYATPHQTRSHTTLRHTTPHATCHTTLLYAILYQIAPQNGTLHHCTVTLHDATSHRATHILLTVSRGVQPIGQHSLAVAKTTWLTSTYLMPTGLCIT